MHRYIYDQAAQFIVQHEYQKAFFKRTYSNTAPSPVDGKILEAVGNIKDRDYTDTWGEKGIGSHVIALKLQELAHKIEHLGFVLGLWGHFWGHLWGIGHFWAIGLENVGCTI